jgi:two-component system CheB/CheR fusion protein
VLSDLTPIQREIRGRKNEWYLVRARPYRTLDDKIDGVVMTFVDVTERQRIEEALRASEENLRRQIQLVELSRAPIFVWDFDTGEVRQWNRGSEELYGYGRDEVLGKVKRELLNTVVPGHSFEAVREELLTRGEWKGELEQTVKNGRSIRVEARLELATVAGIRSVLESSRDITQSKIWESRQKLLLSELTHRVKNILAVVQGLVHQTRRTSESKDDFVRRLEGRFAALASAHGLLVESEWRGADLRELVEGQLTPYVSEGKRLRIEGEPVTLPAEIATPLGLVLHELATNAMKYGALSNDKGRVDVSWNATRNNEQRLKFTWREENGPPVKKPSSHGFGAQLIQHGLPGAAVKHEFPPGGVQCTIEFSLAENVQNEPAGARV